MVDVCEQLGIENPIICASINKIGFRVSGSIESYENYLTDPSKKFRPIAMQVLAAGALKPKVAIEYIGKFPKIEAVLFGASSKGHIEENIKLIEANIKLVSH
jgi:aryl-alcohol dehydrogenase-like predicted oxidoreductase